MPLDVATATNVAATDVAASVPIGVAAVRALIKCKMRAGNLGFFFFGFFVFCFWFKVNSNMYGRRCQMKSDGHGGDLYLALRLTPLNFICALHSIFHAALHWLCRRLLVSFRFYFYTRYP